MSAVESLNMDSDYEDEIIIGTTKQSNETTKRSMKTKQPPTYKDEVIKAFVEMYPSEDKNISIEQIQCHCGNEAGFFCKNHE